MYKDKRIGVVIPAYNEELFVREVIETVPSFVDKIFVTNDGSSDGTANILASIHDARLIVITHKKRMGTGAAIISGYKKACGVKVDVIATMDGDGQMDPKILDKILDPIVEGQADYSKGNRLSTLEHRREMPRFRCFGNFLLTYLTRMASGYWSMTDPQCGYTAISCQMIRRLDSEGIHKGWPFLNDMLIKLHVLGARVVGIPHQAKYRKRRSKINYAHFVVTTSWLLLKGYLWRIWTEYIKRPYRVVSI